MKQKKQSIYEIGCFFQLTAISREKIGYIEGALIFLNGNDGMRYVNLSNSGHHSERGMLLEKKLIIHRR